jgi:PD-(D/E)XK nuclease superfamily
MLGFGSREDAKEREQREGFEMAEIEELARPTIDFGLKIHKDEGPGLPESVFEAMLASALVKRGIKVDRQVPLGTNGTYLRLAGRPLGVPLNFGAARFRKGVRRIVNDHTDVASSPLRVNQPSLIQVIDRGE